MKTGTRRILYVDSDVEARLIMRDLLAPHHLDATATDEEARVLARRHSYDIYLLSGGGPASNAIALCAWLHRIDPRTPIVFCSSNGSAQYQQAAVSAGALRYQVKPLDPRLLRSTLSLLLKLAEMESERAMTAARAAIDDELLQRSQRARADAAAARDRAQQAIDRMLHVKAYRAFRDAGGNRANFERMWPVVSDDLSDRLQ